MSGRSRRLTGLRLSWGVIDQGVSSLKNLLIGAFVAREFGAADLGVLAMVLLAYGLIVNGARGVGTDPLMVRYSGAADERWRSASASATGAALVVGLLGGLICAATGLGILAASGHSVLGVALLTLSVGLPGLTLQDSWRYVYFSAGMGLKALSNDTVWTVLLLGSLLLMPALGVNGVGWAVLAFGLTASLAAALGALQGKIVPSPRIAPAWLRRHRDLGSRFLGENLTLGLGGQIRSLTVAAAVSLAAAGAIRGAEMMIAPAVVLLMGAAQVAVPEGAAALRNGVGALRRLCLALSGGLASLVLIWGLVVLVVCPHGLGELLLGSVWSDASVLLPGIIVGAVAGCFHVGPSAGLRALERADRSMRAQMVVAAVCIGTCACGGILWGAHGAVWGQATGSVLGAVIWWRHYAAAEAEREAAPGPVGQAAAEVESTAGAESSSR